MNSPPSSKRKAAIASWILYDLANTAFSMGVVSLYFSLWVRDAVGQSRADSAYGLITAVSMAVIFVLSPILGTVSDHAARKMPFLMVGTLSCVALTALLARFGFSVTVLLFVLANIAYQASLQFYDSLLPEVSDEKNRGMIGGLGVGIGYLGSYLPIVLGLTLGTDDKPRLFLLIAMAYLVFAIPCFIFVRERGNPNRRPISFGSIRTSLKNTIATLKDGRTSPGLARFLVGRFFYTDAINTVISVMGLYTVNNAVASGLSKTEGEREANLVLMVAITFAVAGGFLFGWLTDRWGPKKTLDRILRLWMVVFAAAALTGILGLPLVYLYGVASVSGLALAGVWAADRPYMLQLTPPGRVGEFYGLYGMIGRFSAITGPAIWGLVAYLTIQLSQMKPIMGQGIAILCLMAFIWVSRRILDGIPDHDTHRAG